MEREIEMERERERERFNPSLGLPELTLAIAFIFPEQSLALLLFHKLFHLLEDPD
jgi:hypothetical protein